jgi:hypothetical protein
MISSRFSLSHSSDLALHGRDLAMVADLLCDGERAEVCEHAADLAQLSEVDVDALADRAGTDRPLRCYNFELSEGFCFVLAHDMREATRLIRARGLVPRIVHPVLQVGVFFISGSV